MDDYLKPVMMGNTDQQQRLAALLRQGPMQAQQRDSKSPIDAKSAQKIVDWMGSFNQSGLPNSSQNAGLNALTPDFQSGNYGAPSMNMTGANNITPSFQSANFQTPTMSQGFNPSMFKGIF